MSACVVFGGGGYIGCNWAKRLAASGRFDQVVLADVQAPTLSAPETLPFVKCDVRQPIEIADVNPEWIFNFAAVHREPGHAREEYFDTNLAGAKNVCAFAERTGCKNILFTSSIAVYGPLTQPTSETCLPYPATPYGISKLCAELIHKGWRRRAEGRRLFICRPGVIYGAGDPGNILRMIRAVRKGYFVFPGSKKLRKSYGYIEGLLDSFEFVMQRKDDELTYNYVERDTETLENLVRIVQAQVGSKIPTFTAPLPLLEAIAAMAQIVTRGRSSVHPVRVRKTASSTHVLPNQLIKMGFHFRFDFASSLRDWAARAPGDFS
jgi:nucleoside-diphosphate-sugar epimerase